MPFVRTLAEHSEVTRLLAEGFTLDREFPSEVFRSRRSRVRFVEIEELFEVPLWAALAGCCTRDPTLRFVGSVLEPSPLFYWAEHFSHYGSFFSSCEAVSVAFPALFVEDPGGSPADAIRMNGRRIAIMTSDGSIRIWAESSREIAAICTEDSVLGALSHQGLRLMTAVEAIRMTRSTFVSESPASAFAEELLRFYSDGP